MSNKKYTIRESELKEIIKEMVLLEVYNASDFNSNYTGEKGRQSAAKITPGVLGKNLLGTVTGIPGALMPDKWKEKVQNGDNDFLKWFFGSMGATTDGATGPDVFPNVTNTKIFGGQGLMKGNNPDAHEIFYVKNATDWLRAHSYPYYVKGKCGNCARRVREALNAGGLSAPWGTFADEAKDYLNILPLNGWEEIPASSVGQPGDIVVLDAFRTLDTNRLHPSGHIALFCGDQWISDFKQNNPFGISGKVPANVVHYFRYKNIGR